MTFKGVHYMTGPGKLCGYSTDALTELFCGSF